MSATTKLLDLYRTQEGITSDNAAAIALGVHRATVSGWRQRGTQAEPHVLEKMAQAIGQDAGGWLALVESERARSDADRKAWVRVARQLGAAATVASVALLAWSVGEHHGGLYAVLAALPEPLALGGIMRSVVFFAALVLIWRATRRNTDGASPLLA